MKWRLKKREAVLKRNESLCYRIAYHILQDEKQAVQASYRTLLEIGKDASFFQETHERQEHIVRRAAMRNSIIIRQHAVDDAGENTDKGSWTDSGRNIGCI